MESEEVYSRIIKATSEKQLRLTVSEFKGIEYLHLREYYLDFDEEWKPSTKGVAVKLDIESSKELFIALVEILSLAESRSIVEYYFKELLDDLYPDRKT